MRRFQNRMLNMIFVSTSSTRENFRPAPFFVRFNLSGDQDPPLDLDFQQDAGLDAGATVQAVVHFGKFPNKFATCDLTACIYSTSAPEKAINCAGDYSLTINTESAPDPGN